MKIGGAVNDYKEAKIIEEAVKAFIIEQRIKNLLSIEKEKKIEKHGNSEPLIYLTDKEKINENSNVAILPSKIIDYAVLSSTSLETSEELASSFKIGEAKFILVEGENSKVLSFNIDENRVSIFMDKTVEHKKIFKELTH